MTSLARIVTALIVGGGMACERKKDPSSPPKEALGDKLEPDQITVQHILISFQGKLRGKRISRTQEEAKELAEDLFRRARRGADFDALVKDFTDDQYPGTYTMANRGVPADRARGVYERGGMVPAFGNVGFPLKVGEIGMAAYDPRESPYGWHIIKRLK